MTREIRGTAVCQWRNRVIWFRLALSLLVLAAAFAAVKSPLSGSASSAHRNRTVRATENLNNSVGDFVWDDLNGNGIQDNGEPGVEGVTVQLRDNNDVILASTTTSNEGHYIFSNLADGDYSVEFIRPAGYRFSPAAQGADDTADSDANSSTGRTAEFTLTAGVTDFSRDAGLIGTFVGDKVFGDSNRNGIQDAGESGITGVTVRLLDGSNNVLAETSTRGDGSYKFPIETAGTYSLEFVAPTGFAISPQDQGNDDTLDSDADHVPNAVLPQNWTKERSPNNPVIPLGTGDIHTVDEQYQPTVIRVANGDIWVYVKGTARIYAFKSTNNGETFTIQNGGSPVLAPGPTGAWDDGFILDPVAIYEPATDTIHLYYKGGHYDTNYLSATYLSTAWGHSTAPGSSPTTFTKDPAPILTGPTALAALGGENFVDIRLASIVRIDGLLYFFGHIATGTAHINGADYMGRLFYATANSWTNPVVQDYAFPNNSDGMINNGWVNLDPMVYKQPGSPVYTMLYSEGGFFQGPGYTREIKVATSVDGRVWKKSEGAFLSPGVESWEAKMVYGSTILRKQSGDYLQPELVNGKYLIYYAGLNLANQAASGLVRVIPEQIPEQLTGRTDAFTMSLGERDNSRDVGMYATSTGPFDFASGSGLSISDSSSAPEAVPYPAQISLGGLSGKISKLTVTIQGFEAPVPEDVDMLLVGPTGNSLLIWSGAGGNNPAGPFTVTLDDSAALRLPQSSLTSGTFKPANYVASIGAFSPPAPTGPYGNPGPAGGTATLASQFGGTNPNGVWSLYVRDRSPGDGAAGSIANWNLDVAVTVPVNAVNDSLGTNESVPFSGNVLANDLGAPVPVVQAVTGCADQTAPFNCTTSKGATLSVSANGDFLYTPPAHFSGMDGFGYTAQNVSGVDTATVEIAVSSVANTPSVTNATTKEEAQTTAGLVVTRNAADGPEVTHFKITKITNGSLFKNNGTTQISNGDFITVAEGNAGLRFSPATNLFSPASLFGFDVQASRTTADTGLGGNVVKATVTVSPIAEVPSVTNSSTVEDRQTTAGLVITRNPLDGSEVTHFKITGITGGKLFKNDGTTEIKEGDSITIVEGGAGLKFTPVANMFSSPGSFFGFNAAGAVSADGAGVGLFATASIVVSQVADKPIISTASADEDTQAAPIFISRGIGDGTEVTHFKITQITNGKLFRYDGVTQINNGDFIPVAEAGIGLKFLPNSNLFSPASTFGFVTQASLSSSDAGLGTEVAVASIIINPIAELPSATNSNTAEDVQTSSGLVITRSPFDSGEVSHFRITGITNGRLFKSDGATQINNGDFISAAEAGAGLKFTPTANLFGGSNIFGFDVAGAVNAAGAGLGPAVRVGITVNAVADTPGVTTATTIENTQTTSGLVITRNSGDGAEVTHFKISGIQNGRLFKSNGTTEISNGEFISAADGAAGLRFTPDAHRFSPITVFGFGIQASLSASDAGLGGGVITATINVVVTMLETPSISSSNTTEDTQAQAGLVLSPNALDGSEVTHFKISGIANGRLFKNDGATEIRNNDFITAAEGGAGLKFTPAANLFSPSTIFGFQAYAAADALGSVLSSAAASASITVDPIADTPTVTNAATSKGTQTTSGLVITRNPVDGNEVTHFKITGITNGRLFKNDGTTEISSGEFISVVEGAAGLKFTPAANLTSPTSLFGFGVRASLSNTDAGLGGNTVNAAISVDLVLHTPSVASVTTKEDVQTQAGLVINRNAADGPEVTHFKISGITNGQLFKNDGTTQINNNGFITAAEGAAGLKFTPAANLFSPSTAFGFQTQSASDATGSVLSSGIASVSITVEPVADTPTVTNATTKTNTQTSSGLVIVRHSSDGAEVGHLQISNIQNGRLFQSNGTTEINNADFITVDEGAAGLKFTPAIDFVGTGSFDVQASIGNQTAGLGGGVVTATIQVAPVGGAIAGRILDDQGNPVEGVAIRLTGPQNRLTVTDAKGDYLFDNVGLGSSYTITPSRANFVFNPTQRSLTPTQNQNDAAFVGLFAAGGLNPLDTTEYFVRQQYVDFLNREPDEEGFGFWVRNIDNCGADQGCREVQRINTSAAFFLSIEFQQTGFFVYRLYQAAFGDLPGAPVPIILAEFKPDTESIGRGVIVNQPGWEGALENNRQAYLSEFVQRSRFVSAFPTTMSPADFVDRLFLNAGVPPTANERDAAISEFGSASTTVDVAARIRSLRRVADSNAVRQAQSNQAFVLMQYFGYLRRDPNAAPNTDFSGFDFWLTKLNQFNGDFVTAEMVKAFLTSLEYRDRFPR